MGISLVIGASGGVIGFGSKNSSIKYNSQTLANLTWSKGRVQDFKVCLSSCARFGLVEGGFQPWKNHREKELSGLNPTTIVRKQEKNIELLRSCNISHIGTSRRKTSWKQKKNKRPTPGMDIDSPDGEF